MKTRAILMPELPSGVDARAITYLRVSTREQAEKGGTDEGFSIPAQREANHRKAESLGARIVKEFVDAGESARKADRPALQEMIDYVKTHRISYCIVHKVDRLARNRADDVTIHLALREAGVMLVSATENIDETPSGMLLHGIMSSIAEFYSRNLATEVTKGLVQKASTGGTPTKAPIGYLNVRKRDEVGRELRTIEIDPDRAPLVTWAFRAYATGDWSITRLRDELRARGLVSLPTPKRPSKPLGSGSLHRMLSNPYYKGDVVYRGVTYNGAHEPIIPPEVWYQVQTVMRAHSSAAECTQRHDHYLKGSIYCGQCGSRLIVQHARSKTGTIYPYFICAGRNSRRTPCTRRAVPIELVEKLITNHYKTIQATPTMKRTLRARIDDDFDKQHAASTQELAELTRTRDRLTREQDKLLELHFADAIDMNQFIRQQDRIRDELEVVRQLITERHSEYQDTKEYLADTVDFLENCHALYSLSDDVGKRLCNQALFRKIYIENDDEIRSDLARPFETLVDVAKGIEPSRPTPTPERLQSPSNPWQHPTKTKEDPTSILDRKVVGFSLINLVAGAGLEPATSRL
ncbi:MAG: recombinase family protein [Microbacterium gubbeenense]